MKSKTAARLRHAWLWRVLAAALWLAPMVAVSIVVARDPDGRTVTPLYHAAVADWQNHRPLYTGSGGMNYLPQFVPLFTPYHFVGRIAGDILWRWTAAAGLTAGLWLFCGAIAGADRMRSFTLVTLIALPVCLPALANGQANAHFGAALLLAAWCLKSQRWWPAVALLWLATCIKPLGLAAMGLALAAYPQLWWRLALVLPVFVGLPFALAPTNYAWSQCLAAVKNLRECSAVTENRFADFNGLLRIFGLPLGAKASLAVRALAGVAFMMWCWFCARRENEPRRSLVWLAAAAGFLMLFNPMTEANSYVMLAPALGLMALLEWSRGDRKLGALFAVMGLTMGFLPEPLQHVFGSSFSLFWHPTMTLGFLAALVWLLRSQRARNPRWAPSAAGSASPP